MNAIEIRGLKKSFHGMYALNRLITDGMQIMRDILTDISKSGRTVLVSSHILGELEKIATHYGIIRGGKMIVEMTAELLEKSCPTFLAIKTKVTRYAGGFYFIFFVSTLTMAGNFC